MKVAYLLPGYVRDVKNFNEIKKFLELNKTHQIDVYTNTYDVLGFSYKEPSGGYVNSKKVDKNFLESFIKFKSINIENYEQVNDEITRVSKKHAPYLKVCKEYDLHRSRKLGGTQNNQTHLRSFYGQIRNITKTFSIIEDIESYDLVIKSRYDSFISKLNLNEYEKFIKPNTLFGANSTINGLGRYSDCGGADPSKSSITLDNGYILKTFYDVVLFGDPISMKAWCDIDEEKFGKICSDENFTSTEFKKTTKFDDEIKLNTEFFLSYNYFVLNNMKEYNIIKSPIGVLPRTRYKNSNKVVNWENVNVNGKG